MELLDLSVIDKFNAIGGTIVVVATYFFGEHWMLFAAFLVLNILDYLTGIMKSRMKKVESSSAGLLGIIKKFGYWVMITLGFGMVPILNEVGSVMEIDLSMISPVIGWYILATLSINETRSVIENLVECGVKVPAVIVNGMAITEKLLKAQADIIVPVDGELSIDKEAEEQYKVEMTTPHEELEKRDVVTLRIHTVERED